MRVSCRPPFYSLLSKAIFILWLVIPLRSYQENKAYFWRKFRLVDFSRCHNRTVNQSSLYLSIVTMDIFDSGMSAEFNSDLNLKKVSNNRSSLVLNQPFSLRQFLESVWSHLPSQYILIHLHLMSDLTSHASTLLDLFLGRYTNNLHKHESEPGDPKQKHQVSSSQSQITEVGSLRPPPTLRKGP